MMKYGSKTLTVLALIVVTTFFASCQSDKPKRAACV